MDKPERQFELLKVIVQEYIRAAHPVSSAQIAEALSIEVSPATVRNDMADLEEQGFIHQPHTSAGRIPTEKGYQYYIQHFLKPKELGEKQRRALQQAVHSDINAQEQKLYKVLQAIADLSNEAVFFSTEGDRPQLLGMSRIFRQPEFMEDRELTVRVSEAFDRMDDMMSEFDKVVENERRVLIGSKNPLESDCAVIVTAISLPGQPRRMVGIFGPMRMDYDRNVGILDTIDEIMNEYYDEPKRLL
ncbi:MAG: HTH domain-containing protein [Candidatus Kerfeldbacteria bacterium]|nr:HTH domain-containing protein [Candidatus Kerfeldbacteria bacterium]